MLYYIKVIKNDMNKASYLQEKIGWIHDEKEEPRTIRFGVRISWEN